jgi:hypothetical protein
MYIPACPLTEGNARYLDRQRDTFLRGTPSPDFPGGKGESEHVNRPTLTTLRAVSDEAGRRAMGFSRFYVSTGSSLGEKDMYASANVILRLSAV